MFGLQPLEREGNHKTRSNKEAKTTTTTTGTVKAHMNGLTTMTVRLLIGRQ